MEGTAVARRVFSECISIELLVGVASEAGAEASDGALCHCEIGLERTLFVFTHEHLIFEQARAARGALAELAEYPVHMGELGAEGGEVFLKVAQGDLVGCLAAEEESGEEFVFRKSFRHCFGEPHLELGAASVGQVVDTAVWAALLVDEL